MLPFSVSLLLPFYSQLVCVTRVPSFVRSSAVAAGVLGPLVRLLRTSDARGSVGTCRAARALADLADMSEQRSAAIAAAGAIALLVGVLRNRDPDCSNAAATALARSTL